MSFATATASCETAAPWTGTGSGSGRGPAAQRPPVQNARIVLFFDGTLNNKYNVRARQRGVLPANIRTADADERGSYDNDMSNVARMFDGSASSPGYNGKPYDRFTPIYIEGIGTSNRSGGGVGETDSTYGSATGEGATGIPRKVTSGINQAFNALNGMPTAKPFEYIHLDVYGFSRGAAAARNCIHRTLNQTSAGRQRRPSLRQRLTSGGYTVNDVKFRFAGLYDTVASYGVIHRNDTAELRLTAVSSVDQTIQIAAAEEHRANFRLTNINSASGERSFEVYLPGVHSDIGGGYRSPASASLLLWTESSLRGTSHSSEEGRMRRELRWFRTQGWFTGAGNTLNGGHIDVFPNRVFYVMGAHTIRSNGYCMIPLNMMADYSNEQDLRFANCPSVPGALSRVNSRLRAYAASKRANGSSVPGDWFHRTSAHGLNLVTLRANWLHFSAHYQDLSSEVTLTSALVDGLAAPMGPEFSGTTRQRIIQNG